MLSNERIFQFSPDLTSAGLCILSQLKTKILVFVNAVGDDHQLENVKNMSLVKVIDLSGASS